MPDQSSLFSKGPPKEPLAARMRPRTLGEFIGQEAIIGKGRLLRRAIEADQLSSVIFFGPPGTGKTTLARVIANRTNAHFVSVNAVLAGVKELREAVAEAALLKERDGRRTILFVDEVHRFNKAQQDALLPWVEDGTVVLVGATTENPFFEVNPALVSRSRLFRLVPLGPDELIRVARQALSDTERGYGSEQVDIDDDALSHLVNVSNGDARTLLNALQLAADTTPRGPDGRVRIDLAAAEDSIQRRAVLYDREGDAHFDTISAFIKSVRGSDPDASLYWLARMLYAGEDPRFILRRLVILASEDVGLADPSVLPSVMACATAFDRIGLPEGRFPLAQATLLLATAPKSNSTMGLFDALAAVAGEGGGEVPVHLKDPSRDKEGMGHGAGYLYPHAYRDHWVAQQYLPSALQGRLFWQPSDQGYEGALRDGLARRREAQLAAMVEAAPEPLSAGPADRAVERWIARSQGELSARLIALRDLVFEAAELSRHHLVADLNARTGLLLWEAARRTPEGHAWGCGRSREETDALAEMAQRWPELSRPRIVTTIAEMVQTAKQEGVRFDVLIGRELGRPDTTLISAIGSLLAAEGRLVWFEPLPRETQRLTALLPDGSLPPLMLAALRDAEDRVYAETESVSWGMEALCEPLRAAGLAVEASRVVLPGEITITRAMLARWLSREEGSLGSRIARAGGDYLSLTAGLHGIEGRTVPWNSTFGRLIVTNPAG